MASSSRRSSYLTERKDIGDPYQIYTEIVNAGKHLEGSKKKVKWLFGFSDCEEEFEVTLLHSVVSGKKTVYENGREIVSTSTMMSTEFSHGWSSQFTYRMYRVEVEVQFTSEHNYVFSIDGVPFNQLPDKASITTRKSLYSRPSLTDNSRYGSEVAATSAQKPAARTSIGSTSQNNPTAPKTTSAANSTNSKNTTKSENDPFAVKFDAFSDPFGETTTTTTAKAAPVLSAPPSSKPNNVENRSKKDEVTFTKSNASQSERKVVEFDLLSGSNENAFDPFGKNTTNSANDFFANESDFNEAPKPNLSNSNSKSRRSSAQEISLDFAGLTFDQATNSAPAMSMPSNQTPAMTAKVEATQSTSTQPPSTSESNKGSDLWNVGSLVDLDLKSDKVQQQRRMSATNSGPSLDNLLVNSNNSNRRSSFTANNMANNTSTYSNASAATVGSNSNNLSTNDLIAAFNDPFGAPSLLTPAPLTNANNNSNNNFNAMPPRAPYPQPQMHASPGQVISNLGMNNGPGNYPMYNANNRGSFHSANTIGNGAKNQSSLDTLDWRS